MRAVICPAKKYQTVTRPTYRLRRPRGSPLYWLLNHPHIHCLVSGGLFLPSGSFVSTYTSPTITGSISNNSRRLS
jgi:hypothetical protein